MARRTADAGTSIETVGNPPAPATCDGYGACASNCQPLRICAMCQGLRAYPVLLELFVRQRHCSQGSSFRGCTVQGCRQKLGTTVPSWFVWTYGMQYLEDFRSNVSQQPLSEDGRALCRSRRTVARPTHRQHAHAALQDFATVSVFRCFGACRYLPPSSILVSSASQAVTGPKPHTVRFVRDFVRSGKERLVRVTDEQSGVFYASAPSVPPWPSAMGSAVYKKATHLFDTTVLGALAIW